MWSEGWYKSNWKSSASETEAAALVISACTCEQVTQNWKGWVTATWTPASASSSDPSTVGGDLHVPDAAAAAATTNGAYACPQVTESGQAWTASAWASSWPPASTPVAGNQRGPEATSSCMNQQASGIPHLWSRAEWTPTWSMTAVTSTSPSKNDTGEQYTGKSEQGWASSEWASSEREPAVKWASASMSVRISPEAWAATEWSSSWASQSTQHWDGNYDSGHTAAPAARAIGMTYNSAAAVPNGVPCAPAVAEAIKTEPDGAVAVGASWASMQSNNWSTWEGNTVAWASAQASYWSNCRSDWVSWNHTRLPGKSDSRDITSICSDHASSASQYSPESAPNAPQDQIQESTQFLSVSQPQKLSSMAQITDSAPVHETKNETADNAHHQSVTATRPTGPNCYHGTLPGSPVHHVGGLHNREPLKTTNSSNDELSKERRIVLEGCCFCKSCGNSVNATSDYCFRCNTPAPPDKRQSRLEERSAPIPSGARRSRSMPPAPHTNLSDFKEGSKKSADPWASFFNGAVEKPSTLFVEKSTRYCKLFQLGRCSLGDSCIFRHEHVPECKYYLEGFCKIGARCEFRHDGRAAAAPPPPKSALTVGHIPVLRDESIDALLAGGLEGTYVDGTFGRGGHSTEILRRLGENGNLIAFDVDPSAIAVGRELNEADERFRIIHRPFGDIAQAIAPELELDGVLVDIGFSSPQVDQGHRGWSVVEDGPLDLRMNPKAGIPASVWLQQLTAEEIAWVIRENGEDDDPLLSQRLGEAILERQRTSGAYTSTLQLGAVIRDVKKGFDDRLQHPAKLAFQALRNFINEEMEQLDKLMEGAMARLRYGGHLVVITFKPREEAILQRFLRHHEAPSNAAFIRRLSPERLEELYPLLKTSKPFSVRRVGQPIRPTTAEIERNRRCRSAMVHSLVKEWRDVEHTTRLSNTTSAGAAVEDWKPPPYGATMAAGKFEGLTEVRAPPLELIASEDRSGPGDVAAGPASRRLGSSTGKWDHRRPGQNEGDWICPRCGDIQFARNAYCRRCGSDNF